jgi:hypothetical protein
MNLAITRVSVRGMSKDLPSFGVDNSVIVVKGRLVKIAEIFDEYWLEARCLPDPQAVLNHCRSIKQRPDLFTFAQRVPDSEPRYPYYRESDNVAVIPLTSFEHWLSKQITPAARRNIKASEKRGVVVRAAEYDDAYVRGIMAIYNESPVRQGRRFWHYGKDFASVRAENGTYAERSTFLAAYIDGEMVGYLKMVWDERTAAIMQVMSQMKCYEKRPNNALLAEAVRQACARNKEYLLYEAFVYGKKTQSSLTEYKRSNGFVRMELPRYYIPLTRKGALALRMGLHKSQKDRLPEWLTSGWVDLRSKWYGLRSQ